MNYEKLYKESLERARECMKDGGISQNTIDYLCNIFPELAESEDERIRKDIIRVFKGEISYSSEEENEKYIDWLEKQSEKTHQTPRWMINFLNENRCRFASSMDDYDEQREAGGKLDAIIDWLEKQGESIRIKKGKNYLCTKTHKYAGMEWIEGVKYYSPEDYSLVNQGCTCYCPKYSKEEHNNFFKEVEYDGCLEVDKVESKFKVGDWITFYGGKPVKILKVELEQNGILDYLLLDQNGHTSYYNKKYVDENAVPWTIQDAKPGDVLVCPKYAGDIIPNIFIFKNIKTKDNDVFCYCSFLETFRTEGYIANADPINTDFYPATKEQCDLLLSKMREEGYEWDAETKVLY